VSCLTRSLGSGLLFLALIGDLWGQGHVGEKIKFKSEDGLDVTANLFMPHSDTVPFLVLFHQANSSRGEFMEIAPRLNAMGYNCMSVDLRSGNEMNGVRNETKQEAIRAFKETLYINSLPDVRAAIQFANDQYAKGKLIALGSSYSASLVLVAGAEMKGSLAGIISLSPGEYFRSTNQPGDYIRQAAQKVEIPVLVASARNEEPMWKEIFEALPHESRQKFLPSTTGNHGARALWSRFSDAESYWEAIYGFIRSIP
jgi:dienelactone hydrolase